MPLSGLFPEAEQAVTAEGFLHVFPQIYDCECFFVARLRKTASVESLAKPSYKLEKFPFNRMKGASAE